MFPLLAPLLALSATSLAEDPGPTTPSTDAPAAENPLTVVEGLPFAVHTASLPSGLRVLVQPRPDATSVVGYLSFRAGSRYEDQTTSGASHLLEHMLFVGTERWDEAAVRAVIDRAGGVYNGHTTLERVAYYARLPAGQTETLLDWLDQVAFHPTLPADKLDKEREVVFEERGGRDGLTVRALKRLGLGVSEDEAIRAALWPGSTRALRVIGEDESLEGIDIDRLRRFYTEHYSVSNATLIVVGPEDPATILALATARFGELPAGARPSLPDDLGPPPVLGGRQVLRQLLVQDQCKVTLAARGPSAADADLWPASLTMATLEIGLNDHLRIQRGLTYGVHAWASALSDSGELRVSAETDCDNVDTVADAFEQAIEALRQGEVNADWLERARGATLGSWSISQEDSYSRAYWLGGRSTLAQPFENADWRGAIPQVTGGQLSEVARRWMPAEAVKIFIERPILTITEAWVAGLATFALFMGTLLRWRARLRRPTGP